MIATHQRITFAGGVLKIVCLYMDRTWIILYGASQLEAKSTHYSDAVGPEVK